MTEVSSSGWSRRGVRRALAVAVVAVFAGAAVGYAISHEKPPEDSHPQPPSKIPVASDAELALIAPLKVGSPLAGFEVVQIHPIDDEGALQVVCKNDRSVVRLDVFLGSSGGPKPPATAGKYSVFYSLDGATQGEGKSLATALAAVLQTNAAAPTPPALHAFTGFGGTR